MQCLRFEHFITLSLLCCIIEPVIDFSLEPNGSKLAIIHGEPPTRISVSFYKINEKGTPPAKLSNDN